MLVELARPFTLTLLGRQPPILQKLVLSMFSDYSGVLKWKGRYHWKKQLKGFPSCVLASVVLA